MTPEQILLWKSIIKFGLTTAIELGEFFQKNKEKSFDELLAQAKELSAKKYEDYDPDFDEDGLTPI